MTYKNKAKYEVGNKARVKIPIDITIEKRMRNATNPEIWSYYITNHDKNISTWVSEPKLVEIIQQAKHNSPKTGRKNNIESKYMFNQV